MIKVGITGQNGFIGSHLYNFISIHKNEFVLIPFKNEYFNDKNELKNFVMNCDCIIHLAALNRHNEPNKIYIENISLVDKLIAALKETNSKAHLIFSSSIQENKHNIYGISKKEGRQKLVDWAVKNGSGFTGLIIPNVYGPFGKPFYNSVISTFSYQLINKQQPKIEIDAELKLIYVNELVQIILEKIRNNIGIIEEAYFVPHSYLITVSEILYKLKLYKELYFDNSIIPEFNSSFDVNLFNTFRSYINIENYFPMNYKINLDERGSFIELIKTNSGGQVSYSVTKPGITRGNHFHTRKIERFSVIKGEAIIKLRKYNTHKIYEFKLSGNNPSFIDIPIWFSHNITNIGKEELITAFWVNEFYDPSDPDTYFEPVM